ncbi:MAG: hypothetical protein ACJA0Q_001527, partial [Saprospiraceae bacterium]
MKKSIIYLAAAIIAIPALNSCKKGEEDPLSFNSRDSRVTGTWNLVSMEMSETETEKTISLNSVNTEKNTEDVVTTTTAVLSGGALTVTTNVKSDEEDVNNTYNGTSWETNTTTTATESESTFSQTYSVVVSIYKDNTYTQTVTEGASSVKSTTTFTSGGTSVVS